MINMNSCAWFNACSSLCKYRMAGSWQHQEQAEQRACVVSFKKNSKQEVLLYPNPSKAGHLIHASFYLFLLWESCYAYPLINIKELSNSGSKQSGIKCIRTFFEAAFPSACAPMM